MMFQNPLEKMQRFGKSVCKSIEQALSIEIKGFK